MKIQKHITKQKGVAIILAMSVVALAAVTATAMTVSQSTWSRQVELRADHAQALLIAHGGLEWARAVLSEDSRVSDVDHAGEPWAMKLPPIPIENGNLSGHIEDQQGKFNLNNIEKEGKVNLAQLASFRRLLSTLAFSDEQTHALADALTDWIDHDNNTQSQVGAEDDYYLSLQPPHRTANQPLIDIAELALVRGFNDDVRKRLGPFITALPRFTAVNINMAAPEVISAMSDGMKLEDARAITAQRERVYFRKISDFTSQMPDSVIVANENITVASDYFIVTTNAKINETQAHGSALLVRENTRWPRIIWNKYQ